MRADRAGCPVAASSLATARPTERASRLGEAPARDPADADDEVRKQTAISNPRIDERIAGKTVRRVVVVPRKLVNIVVG